jgi:hypothetical protein
VRVRRILQWWFPQCLEVLAFSILGEKQEAAAAVEGTGLSTNSGREKLSASTSGLESSLSREGKVRVYHVRVRVRVRLVLIAGSRLRCRHRRRGCHRAVESATSSTS